MRHLVTMVAAIALAGLAFAVSAAGAQTATGGFTFTDTNVDDGVSAICGFTVTETDFNKGRFETFFDSSGTPTRIQVEDHYTGFFSANGVTVGTAGASLTTFGPRRRRRDRRRHQHQGQPPRRRHPLHRPGPPPSSTPTATSSPRQAPTQASTATSTGSAPR